MAENLGLNQYVTVRGRYYRSVQIKMDWGEKKSLNEYILTPTAQNLAVQILGGAISSQGPKAWSIIGPYGTGKSAFSLFLIDLFCSEVPVHTQGKLLREQLFGNNKPFIPVLLYGHRNKLNKELLRGLSESFTEINPEISQKATSLQNRENVVDIDVINLFNEANYIARLAGFGGLIILIDEFGKFLEYAAQYPGEEDVFTLQHLAELAERSNPPIIVITVLHTAFSEYLHSLDRSQQLEWQKVQGRFTPAPFLEPYEQLIHLIGSAIVSNFPPEINSAYQQKINQILSDDSMSETQKRIHLNGFLPACLPLHPLTALLLPPLFRGKLTQNERSLFAFITSKEPFGFQDFLASSVISNSIHPLYSLDLLYDYVINALGSTVFIGDRSHRWAGIESALQRIPSDWPVLTISLVKAIGLLGLYGPQVGLKPSLKTLKLLFDDENAVIEALKYLTDASIVIFRKYEDAYGLWEGSDVNLEEEYEIAKTRIAQGSIATRLKEIIRLRPIVARAHYIRNGAIRYFAVDVIDGTENALMSALSSDFQPASGSIIYVLTSTTQDRQKIIEFTKNNTSSTDKLRIFAFPRPLAGLESSIQEVEAWRWINDNVKALQGDPIASQEVRSQLIYARERLTQIAGEVMHLGGFQFTPQASEWIQCGDTHLLRTEVAFQKWLSDILDQVYCESPVLKNELLNRDGLSSSAAAARRNLLSAMIENETKCDLSFTGNPAEYSMYLALLKQGGFHRLVDGEYRFVEPGYDWQPVWQKIDEYLELSVGKRQPINQLFDTLRKPPLGLKYGPLPIVLCAYLLSKRNQVALYENGIFVPNLRIEVFERLIRVPDVFEIQLYEFDLITRDTFQDIDSVLRSLNLTSVEHCNKDQSLLKIVKPLVLFSAKLPAFSKKTKHLEPIEAVAVREALIRAKDPYNLIFIDLPSIFSISLDSIENIRLYSKSLANCLSALQRAYPLMLDELEEQMRITFGLDGNSNAIRQQFCIRAKPLVNYVVDRDLGLFVREAAKLDQDNRDWREVLGRAINQGIPTDQWTDMMLVDYQVRLMQIAADFLRLEELVGEKNGQSNAKILRIGVLGDGFEQERTIISIQKEKEAEINLVADKVSQYLRQNLNGSGNDRQVQLAVLTKLVVELLQNKG